jgi:hypothetical protein
MNEISEVLNEAMCMDVARFIVHNQKLGFTDKEIYQKISKRFPSTFMNYRNFVHVDWILYGKSGNFNREVNDYPLLGQRVMIGRFFIGPVVFNGFFTFIGVLVPF